MAVALDGEAVGYGNASRCRDAADVVAPKIEQHQVFCAFFRVCQQRLLGSAIGQRRCTARARPGDRPHGDLTVADPDEDFRARADDCESGQVEEIEEGRGVHPAQRAVKFDGWQRERAGKTLGEHHLEDIACDDIILRFRHHRPVGRCLDLR